MDVPVEDPGDPPPFAVGEGDHAGIAVVDITPVITETFTDLNGDFEFDGCRYDPTASDGGCDEPFDDANGNGEFDAVFIGGYGPLRPAQEVHDPIEVRALVLARGDSYLALVSMDLVGLGIDRTVEARNRLGEKGWNTDNIVISSSHNHAGPDVRGLWGNPEPGEIWPGASPAYNASVVDAIVQAVEMAADSVEPVQVRMGAVRLRDQSEWFNGRHFGGKNPGDKVHGLMNDIRDPVIVSDQVFALQAVRPDGSTVATLVNQAGHPEVTGEKHNVISSDWVHYMRVHLEDKLGGRAMFLPECLGGMQSALGGYAPMVDENGQWRMTKDETGADVPEMKKEDSPEFAHAIGVHIADAAMAALKDGDDVQLDPFTVAVAPMYVPVDNGAYQLLFKLGLFDVDPALVVVDPGLCPGKDPNNPLHPGCVPDETWRIQLGPATIATAPGEVLPELFWGLPTDDPRWDAESKDPKQRGSVDGRDSAYFPQHPPACDATTFAECSNEIDLGDCNCRKLHDWPYRIAMDPAAIPIKDLMDTKYRLLIGNAGDHLGYIIPDSDFHTLVSFFSEFSDADHYEETVSASITFAVKLLAAQISLSK